MTKDLKFTWHEPNSRLTAVANAMIGTLLDEMEGKEVWAVIMLTDRDRSGIALHGYEDIKDAIPDLFTHMEAILETQGIGMDVMEIKTDTDVMQ